MGNGHSVYHLTLVLLVGDDYETGFVLTTCDVDVKLLCFRYFQTWFVITIRTLMYETYL